MFLYHIIEAIFSCLNLRLSQKKLLLLSYILNLKVCFRQLQGNFKAQWSLGVAKPIHEISNVQTNANFLEAFGSIFIKNIPKTLFKADFSYFEKLWKLQNWCFLSKPGFYGKNLSAVIYNLVQKGSNILCKKIWKSHRCQPVGTVLSPPLYWDW